MITVKKNKAYNSRIYPHQNWKLPEYQKNKHTIILEKAEKGEKLTRAEKDAVFNELVTNSYNFNGKTFMIGGYYHNFDGLLNSYIVEYKDGFIKRFYSFDKTAIRKNPHINKNIFKIYEV